MASAHNLIGLVNQLQNIESTMMAAIMEMLMKVATLTDANVFLLVDAVEGRRFAGKRHLVDAYLGGTLSPVGTDVEMELDPSVTALRRRPVNAVGRQGTPFRPPFPYRHNGAGGGGGGGGGGSQDRNFAASMKRHMTSSAFHSKDVDETSGKRVRVTNSLSSSSSSSTSTVVPTSIHAVASNGVVDVEPVIESTASLASIPTSSTNKDNPVSKPSTSSSSSSSSSTDAPGGVKSLAEALKTEHNDDVKPWLDIRGFNDDERDNNGDDADAGGGGGVEGDATHEDGAGSGDSDVEELAFDDSIDGTGSRNNDSSSSSFLDGSSFLSHPHHHHHRRGGDVVAAAAVENAASSSSSPSEFNADFDILAFLRANPKATALRAEFDVTVLDKSAVTHKLLTSLLYDISKASAANAPIKDKKSEVSRAYFNYVFENVWDYFPNFEGLMTMGAKVSDGGKRKNIKYYMRHKMQKWYGAMMDKMLGAEQLQLQQQQQSPIMSLQWQ